MDKELLTSLEIRERIAVLENWILKGAYTEMIGTARNELFYYVDLLTELYDSNYPRIESKCPTQIYQQIGIVI